MTVPMDPELAEHVEAQRAEYGTYRAKGPIYVGTALAYREGDPVPVSNVERHKYDAMGLVVKVGTAAERKAFPAEFTDDADPTAPQDDAAAAASSADASSTETATTRSTTRRTSR